MAEENKIVSLGAKAAYNLTEVTIIPQNVKTTFSKIIFS